MDQVPGGGGVQLRIHKVQYVSDMLYKQDTNVVARGLWGNEGCCVKDLQSLYLS